MARVHRATRKKRGKTHSIVLGISVGLITAAMVLGCIYQLFFQRQTQESAARIPPPLLMPAAGRESSPEASFHNGQGESGAIDLSNIRDGYILARCLAGRTAYLLIEKDGKRASEYLPADSKWYVYPLTMDDGAYNASICLNKVGVLYDKQVAVNFDVAVADPMKKFLLPNYLVNYHENSAVVALAHQLYAGASTDEELVRDTLVWMQDNLQYNSDAVIDENDRVTVDHYLPDLERLLREKHGICSDYASLFAAIMRINGIPCQLIYGDVRTDGETVKRHAWNLLWLQDEQGGAWRQYDPTKTFGSLLHNPVDVASTGHEEQGNYSLPEQIH